MSYGSKSEEHSVGIPIFEGESYWPEENLPEQARGWCRIYVGTAAYGINQTVLEFWKTGEYRFFIKKD